MRFKTREFSTKLMHHFSISDHKGNHHQRYNGILLETKNMARSLFQSSPSLSQSLSLPLSLSLSLSLGLYWFPFSHLLSCSPCTLFVFVFHNCLLYLCNFSLARAQVLARTLSLGFSFLCGLLHLPCIKGPLVCKRDLTKFIFPLCVQESPDSMQKRPWRTSLQHANSKWNDSLYAGETKKSFTLATQRRHGAEQQIIVCCSVLQCVVVRRQGAKLQVIECWSVLQCVADKLAVCCCVLLCDDRAWHSKL